jgi:hypothetical protein
MSVRLEIDKDPVCIKFAEAEPFAFLYRHWVNKIPYTCSGEDCPLCTVGDKHKPVLMYNVIDLADGTVKVWELSADPTRRAQKHHDTLADKGKTMDYPGVAFVVSKKRKDCRFYEYDVEQFEA